MLKRNPFPMIGKVIKYELKNTYFQMLIALGIVIAISVLNKIFGITNDFGKYSYTSEYNYSVQETIVRISITVMNFACMGGLLIFALASFAARFKRTMLGDDAYVTMTLPVTTFEHLFGRFVTGLIWSFSCLIVIMLSVTLLSSNAYNSIDWSEFVMTEEDKSIFMKSAGFLLFTYLVITVWAISCVFVVNGVRNINKGLAGCLLAAMIIFYIFFGQVEMVNSVSGTAAEQYMTALKNYNLNANLPYLGLALINYIGAHLIFSKNLNIK